MAKAERGMEGLTVSVRSGSHGHLEQLGGSKHCMPERRGLSKDDVLHKAIWGNHLDLLEQMIEEDCAVDIQDEESGWTPLHKALYWGKFRAASLVLGTGASLQNTDHKARTALDLLSQSLHGYLGSAAVGELYSWGNGANYQLGSGAVGLQETPVRLDSLHGASLQAVAAAKFHSAAIDQDGQLYTWGFGRGGRLGHGEFHIHSGASAVILPQRVASFAKRQVTKVVLAKHHTAALTSTGELFTWGSNRDGRLGYPATDTQPTPRKINTFNRQRLVDVAVANRHTVALLDDGSVFSWGSNLQGQLGYGTSDSASNATPRIVEAMKGKSITAVAAAKRHTVVLTSEGAVYTWGHRVVTPKRVQLAGSRDIGRATSAATGYAQGWEVVFHKGQSEVSKPTACMIAAGAAHSSAVTAEGAVLTWRSMDPALVSQEVGGPLSGKSVVAISAGKYRTAVVTSTGDIYMWEGWSKAAEAMPTKRASNTLEATSPSGFPPEWEVPKSSRQQQKSGRALAFQRINPQRVEGLKRVTGVAVGEKHSLALQSWCAAPAIHIHLSSHPVKQALSPQGSRQLEDADFHLSAAEGVASESYWEGLDAALRQSNELALPESLQGDAPPMTGERAPGCQSLQRLCERCVAENLIEPRTVLQVLEFADAAGSMALRQHCLGVALSNLDLVIQESRSQFEQLLPHILEDLEVLWATQFPQATANAGPGHEGESCTASPHLDRISSSGASQSNEDRAFRSPREEAETHNRAKQERAIRKKLQQIEALELRAQSEELDVQQLAKVSSRPVLLSALQALEGRRPLKVVRRILDSLNTVSGMSSSPGMDSSKASPDQSLRGSKKSRGAVRAQETPPAANDPHSIQRHGPTESPAASALPQSSLNPPSGPQGKGYQGLQNGTPPATPMSRVSGFDQASAAGSETASVQTGEPSTPGPKQPCSALTSQLEESGGGRSAGKGSTSGKKPAKRKGGLSMFLAGQLEEPRQEPRPEPKSAAPAPAPSGTKIPLTWAQREPTSGITTSLRDIQSQEAASSSVATSASQPVPRRQPTAHGPDEALPLAGKAFAGTAAQTSKRPGLHVARPADSSDSATTNGITIAMDDLVRKSKPIAVAKPSIPERRAPAWGNAPVGASPPAQTRLQDIQAEQEQKRESSARSWGAAGASPGSQKSQFLGAHPMWRQTSQNTVSGLGSSPSLGFPAGTSPSSRRGHIPHQPQNKWYIKDEPEIVPLRCIQTEETAMKELSELYGARGSEVAPPQPAAAKPEPPSASKKKSRPRPRQNQARKSDRRRPSDPTPRTEGPQSQSEAAAQKKRRPQRRSAPSVGPDKPDRALPKKSEMIPSS